MDRSGGHSKNKYPWEYPWRDSRHTRETREHRYGNPCITGIIQSIAIDAIAIDAVAKLKFLKKLIIMNSDQSVTGIQGVPNLRV